ncbi:PREDICTED: uncharacterized protein At5g01610 [Theobroma cacao]|uniref:Uncharacterized protein At5g01610 n=1 Tax=Theobroma cacao TaxID=3641 RepID=A0AB32VX64_THECC|nr:PREDICTED: uncharacterized protein At5g01610 [Theobroma cacao]
MSLHPKPFSSIAFLPYILLFLISSSSSSSSSASGDNTLTAYEVLEEYDFPIGLLPNGVLSYELDNSTGEFSVYLNGSCTFSIDSYELKYKSTITGVISKDKLTSLSGIKVKVLFLWLNIRSVIRDDDELELSVGIASADFSVDNFSECPTCGCGFDCDTVGRKINSNHPVSSA